MENEKIDEKLEQIDYGNEIQAIAKVYEVLKPLSPQSIERVLNYMNKLFNNTKKPIEGKQFIESYGKVDEVILGSFSQDEHNDHYEINPSALKWLKRNNISIDVLSQTFAVGMEEFDIVAKKIPGKSKKERTKIIFLLMGVASYLKNGTLKFSHEHARETCLHYDAWDSDNFSNYLRSYNGDISGSKTSGYTLTARGLSLASDIIKQIVE